MKQARYNLVLFDMDGTIADTDPMIVATFNDLYDKYRGGKRRPPEELYYFSGPPIRETLRKEFPELDEDAIFKEFYQVSRGYYETHIFPYPNCKEVLTKLKSQGITLGVVTNKLHDLALVVVDILGLTGLFDVVIGSDNVSKTKPDKEGMLKAIEMVDGQKEKTLYVGDNAMDLVTANNAGTDCCLVNWGPRVLPKGTNPKYMINSYLELEGIVYE